MPEAEDVLLDAAERAAFATREVWRRFAPAASAAGVCLDDERRRLGVWLAACFGQAWPLAPADPALAPRWLARALGDLAPWQRAPQPTPFCDGRQIFLPRRLAPAPPLDERALLLLMALGQARRLRRGALDALPTDPAARDLCWALEGGLADSWLAHELPGLAAALEASRAHALRQRPDARELRPAERDVEQQVLRNLVELPPRDAPTPAQVACRAAELASRIGRDRALPYRGMAPVAHWGVPRPDLVARAAQLEVAGSADQARAGGRSRVLPRRVEGRTLTRDELEGRAGPFVLPFGDPKLSVQDPAGLQRPRDSGDEEELDALASELARLPEVARVQADAAVREVLASEDGEREIAAAPGAAAAAPPDAVLAYPEWDALRGAFRPAYCHVRERLAPRRDEALGADPRRERERVWRELRRRFEALRPRRLRFRRQLGGDELDLDGFVEEFADRAAGLSPTGRVYSIERKALRDIAVALLVDVSGSTDAQVSGTQRVIDVEKEAALCFCEALDALGDRHAVYAFSGRGPRDVRVTRLKAFSERLGPAVRGRIGGLAPDAFTRLGAALRHVTARLAEERARLRILLVISDGKPYDEDEYSGRHGIEDVRAAVGEARLLGVRPFCVAVDRGGASYLTRLFGPVGHTIVWNVAQLPTRLTEIYRKLTAL